MYSSNPQNIEVHKENICAVIAGIPLKVFKNVMEKPQNVHFAVVGLQELSQIITTLDTATAQKRVQWETLVKALSTQVK